MNRMVCTVQRMAWKRPESMVEHGLSIGRYIHVSVEIFSGAIFASVHVGEKARCKTTFSPGLFYSGHSPNVKTDNGPAYASKSFKHFLDQ